MGKDHILLYSDCSPTWSKEPPQNSSWPPLLWPDQQLNPHSSSCVFAQTTRTFQLWILFHLFYKNKKTNKETRWAKEGCVGGSLYIRNPNWAISNLWGLALLFFLFFLFFCISRQTFSNFVLLFFCNVLHTDIFMHGCMFQQISPSNLSFFPSSLSCPPVSFIPNTVPLPLSCPLHIWFEVSAEIRTHKSEETWLFVFPRLASLL